MLVVWFGLHALFAHVETRHLYALTIQVPDWPSRERRSLLLSAIAAILLSRLKAGMMMTLGICYAAGIAVHLLGLL